MTQQIPLVDWNDYRAGGERRKHFIKTFGDAFRHFGFVRLTGHGVDENCLEDMNKRVALLFSLKTDVLMRYFVKELAGKTGYTPFRRETAVGYNSADEKHFWHVCREEEGPNLWPDESRYPFLSGFRANARQLYDAMDNLFVRLMGAMEEYLELPGGTLKTMVQGANNSTLRLLHYPKLQEDRPRGAIRAGAHKDINMLTLLPAATSSGLQVKTVNGVWVPIEAVEGELVVNAGIMLERVTNGYIPATWHQVVNPDDDTIPDEDRYSSPYFGHPRASAILDVPERFRGSGFPEPPPPITGAAALAEVLAAIKLA